MNDLKQKLVIMASLLYQSIILRALYLFIYYLFTKKAIFAEPSDSFILISNKVIFLLTLSTLILYYYSAK